MKFLLALRTHFWVWLTRKSPSVFYHPLAYPEWERMQQDLNRRQEQAQRASSSPAMEAFAHAE